ncbi:unannotated protein [freshwater metagenome]|uniref:Unannotated protein n=2 Tax=freshwater metagenome TaxID=449393 RepID=A0A6J7CG95_9ZZZZ
MPPPARSLRAVWGIFMRALLRKTATNLKQLGSDGSLVAQLSNQMFHVVGNSPSPAESRSWESSLPVLAQDLIDCGLGDVDVLLEYQLPYTSKRIDAIVCGSDPKTGKPSLIVVELKQWSSFELVAGTTDLVSIGAYGNQPLLHPAEQVKRYCEHLEDFNRFIENSDAKLMGVAYLHNWLAVRNAAIDKIPTSVHGQVFLGSEKSKWHDFLKANLSANNSTLVADGLLSGKLAPTKQLMDLAADEIRSQNQFVLLDEQKVAFSLVMKAVRESNEANTKTAIIVTGGPGTGKSVIALALLGELSREGKTTLHATGSKAFRNSLRKIAGNRAPQVQKMFSYFNSFMTVAPNSLEVLICDEAHRIRETSANRYTKADNRTGTPQVNELLRTARVPVFFLDSHQVVRKGELGTPEYIEKSASDLGIKTYRVDLDGQFRCGGSRLYENWILGLLDLNEQAPSIWEEDLNFKVSVVDSPEEMESVLSEKLKEGYKARITAGFCWTWNDPTKNGTLPLDVKIGTWQKPWNVKGDRGVGGYMSGELWAIDPKGFDQIGCVYTAQGFEYDWNGVIFGPDLVWRNGQWLGVIAGSKDPAMRGVSQEAFDQLVRNTYKVLLTRGLSGTLVYSVDPETQKHLKQLI